MILISYRGASTISDLFFAIQNRNQNWQWLVFARLSLTLSESVSIWQKRGTPVSPIGFTGFGYSGLKIFRDLHFFYSPSPLWGFPLFHIRFVMGAILSACPCAGNREAKSLDSNQRAEELRLAKKLRPHGIPLGDGDSWRMSQNSQNI